MRKEKILQLLCRLLPVLLIAALMVAALPAQTNCAEGNDILDTAQPKNLSVPDLIQKFVAGEDRVKDAHSHYSYTQDVMVQTLDDKGVTGQFHQIASISFDDKGKRVENVTFSEQPTLRDIRISAEDWDDIRVFMPWILTKDELPQYNLTYAGQQHVDDLDTYVFHIAPKKEEKNRRYFEGRLWVDDRDLQVVKLCGKSVPQSIRPKKNQGEDVRPTFVTYRQIVDGNWFPAYSRVDDTIQFATGSVHVREVVKFTGFKRAVPAGTALKP